MSALPVERFKGKYVNWRWNPFTSADYAIDKEEDNLAIPAGAPFVVQLLEVPRKNDPTSISVRCYDTETEVDDDSASGQKVLKVTSTVGFSNTDKIIVNRDGAREEECVIASIQDGVSLTMVDNLTDTHTQAQADDVEKYIEFAEVAGAPAQSQFRVDYPPADGEGTGLLEFNNGDNSKIIRVNYKATGSPMISEFLDTKVSHPAGNPVDNQILAFVSGAPTWKYNPRPYFHEGSVIYNAGGEDESCLLFRFKRRAEDQKVLLELKGAKLHQGFYSELFQHNHGVGTLAADAVAAHSHGKGTLASDAVGTHTHAKGTLDAEAVAAHNHAKGSLSGSQGTHTHGVGTLAAVAVGTHTHLVSGNTGSKTASHTHAKGTLAADAVGTHSHGIGGSTGIQSVSHNHGINIESGGSNLVGGGAREYNHTGQPTALSNHDHMVTGNAGNQSASHAHNAGTFSIGNAGDHGHTISGSTASGGASHFHSVSITSAADGDHGHSISGATAAAGNEAVTIAGLTADAGGHGHVISGSTAAEGGHGHTISGSTAAGGGHGHALSGSSANAGVAAKTYCKEAKIYLDGADKTASFLTKSGLDKLGDGTNIHDFVVSGSGEVDVSDWCVASKIYEIKITQALSGYGGRVLCHIELY